MAELWDIVDENGNKTGRLHQRGKPMKKGDFHLAVSIWIVNSNGQFLISRRTPERNHMWETTSGGVLAGEGSLEAALRETKEELDITLDPNQCTLFKSYVIPHRNGDGMAYFNVWVFHHDADIKSVILQPEETCDAKWADKNQIKRMIDEGIFTDYSYIDELFNNFRPK